MLEFFCVKKKCLFIKALNQNTKNNIKFSILLLSRSERKRHKFCCKYCQYAKGCYCHAYKRNNQVLNYIAVPKYSSVDSSYYKHLYNCRYEYRNMLRGYRMCFRCKIAVLLHLKKSYIYTNYSFLRNLAISKFSSAV